MGLRGAAHLIPGGQAGRNARRSAGWEQEVATQDPDIAQQMEPAPVLPLQLTPRAKQKVENKCLQGT